jgi:error-prone DNA polymerase
LVPIENATMEARTVIQWDKDSLEELGLFKIDLLGLGALHQLHRGFDLIERHDGKRFTLATIPAEDPATFEMIRRADTVGVFQIESRAQMAMLPRLKPLTYYDLVVEVSIVRPGPITGGMVHPYLRRREGTEAITYPHPCLEPVLEKTLGVPLFQEQVIRLAMVAADYTPGEADQLRRDMAAWRRTGRLERHHARLVQRMTAKGIPPEFAERVFEQIRGFGEYGFPESHAASFALIAYATAWMKRRYPAAFACSLLNAQPMGFYSPATIVEDARRHRIEIRPIDVLASAWDCTLEAEGEHDRTYGSPVGPGFRRGDGGGGGRLAIRMGLRYVRGLAAGDGERIVSARDERPFASPEDFAIRTGIDAGALARLAEAGGFERLDPSRRSALWKVRGAATGLRPSLEVTLGERPAEFADLGWFDTIGWDYQTTAHSPRGHPLEPLRPRLRALGLPDARTLAAMADGSRVRYAGMAICRQRPGTASGVVFMTMEDESGFVNAIIWPAVFEAFAVLIKTRAFLGVTGLLQVRDGTHLIVAQRFWVPPLRGKPASGGSRDFH